MFETNNQSNTGMDYFPLISSADLAVLVKMSSFLECCKTQ